METEHTVDGASTAALPEEVRHGASNRRATACQRKARPQGPAGDIAKGLNANRGTVAAGLSHLVRASEITKDHTAK